FLARVAARKAQVGANYPAGINAGKPFKRDTRRTPWFDASDIAVPCCGAAATIVTSDDALIEAIASSKTARFRTAPLTEVLALGASGLVQINKAHHLFCVDRRYLLEADSRQGFREDGALAFTTSVGGPLSHIVCSLLRGGHQEHRPSRQRLEPAAPAPVSAAWEAKARLLWMLLPSQLRAVPDAWLVEATTSVSIRSCLRALSADDVSRLDFEGLEELIAAPFLGEVRKRLRTVVAVAQQESERLSSMFDVFRLLTDEVR